MNRGSNHLRYIEGQYRAQGCGGFLEGALQQGRAPGGRVLTPRPDQPTHGTDPPRHRFNPFVRRTLAAPRRGILCKPPSNPFAGLSRPKVNKTPNRAQGKTGFSERAGAPSRKQPCSGAVRGVGLRKRSRFVLSRVCAEYSSAPLKFLREPRPLLRRQLPKLADARSNARLEELGGSDSIRRTFVDSSLGGAPLGAP
jgi:hypothetical protein